MRQNGFLKEIVESNVGYCYEKVKQTCAENSLGILDPFLGERDKISSWFSFPAVHPVLF